jgi:hypothetical protein
MDGRLRVGVCAVAALLFSGCWLQPRYGPEGQSFNPLEETITSENVGTLTQAWQVEAEYWGVPLVRGGRVFMGMTDYAGSEPQFVTGVEARSLESGTTAWSRRLHSTRSESRSAGVSFVDGKLWVGYYHLPTGDPSVLATRRERLDPDDGSTVGSLDDDGLADVPVEAGGIMADVTSANVAAPTLLTVRDRDTAEPLWSASVPPASGTRPVIAHGQIYVHDGTSLHAFDAEGCGAPTCTPLWTARHGFTTNPRLSPVAATDDGHVVVQARLTYVIDTHGNTASRGVVLIYDSAGTLVWSTVSGSPSLVTRDALALAVAGDAVYVTQWDELQPDVPQYSLNVHSTSSGALLWSADIGTSSPSGGVVIAGDVVYVGVPGAVLTFDRDGCGAATCGALASIPVPAEPGAMTVAQGHLLVQSRDVLTAYRPR